MKKELLINEDVRKNLLSLYPKFYRRSTNPYDRENIQFSRGFPIFGEWDDGIHSWIAYDEAGNAVGFTDAEYIPYPRTWPDEGEKVAIIRIENEWIYLIGTNSEIDLYAYGYEPDSGDCLNDI